MTVMRMARRTSMEQLFICSAVQDRSEIAALVEMKLILSSARFIARIVTVCISRTVFLRIIKHMPVVRFIYAIAQECGLAEVNSEGIGQIIRERYISGMHRSEWIIVFCPATVPNIPAGV